MGIRDRPASAIPVFPFPVSLLPFSLRSLLGPEVVLFALVEVFVEFLVLFEFSELLVDVVAPALERPVRRRLAGQHCPPPAEVSVERPNSGTCSLRLTPPTTPASRCGPACGGRSR